jgi:phage tail sheath gpL-like
VQSDALPNQPRNGLALPQCEAPAKVDRLDFTERNLLLYKGLSTVKYDQAGNVYLDRLITTYQKNSSNVSDATYLDLGVQRTLARMYVEALTLNSKYSRHLVGSDADTLPAGTPVVTPSLLKAAYARWYRGTVDRAWCRNAESVAKSIHVEVDALDPQRMNVSIAPEIALGLVTVATKLSFRLTPSE